MTKLAGKRSRNLLSGKRYVVFLLPMLDCSSLVYRRNSANSTQTMNRPRVANAKSHTEHVTVLTMTGKEIAIVTTATLATTGIRGTEIASGIVSVTEMIILPRDDTGTIIELRPPANGGMIRTRDAIVVRT